MNGCCARLLSGRTEPGLQTSSGGFVSERRSHAAPRRHLVLRAAAGVDRGGCGSFASLPWLPRRPPSWRETAVGTRRRRAKRGRKTGVAIRSEEHTSELQSLRHLVCRLLLEKKNARASLRCSTARALRSQAQGPRHELEG